MVDHPLEEEVIRGFTLISLAMLLYDLLEVPSSLVQELKAQVELLGPVAKMVYARFK